MSHPVAELPFVDEHQVWVAAPREVVWTALRQYTAESLGIGAGHPLAAVLGTRPRTGFEIVGEAREHELTMAGRHRFSRYRLVFHLHGTGARHTLVTARTYAEFPGLHGRLYGALVIGTRIHVVATRQILRAVRRRALDLADHR